MKKNNLTNVRFYVIIPITNGGWLNLSNLYLRLFLLYKGENVMIKNDINENYSEDRAMRDVYASLLTSFNEKRANYSLLVRELGALEKTLADTEKKYGEFRKNKRKLPIEAVRNVLRQSYSTISVMKKTADKKTVEKLQILLDSIKEAYARTYSNYEFDDMMFNELICDIQNEINMQKVLVRDVEIHDDSVFYYYLEQYNRYCLLLDENNDYDIVPTEPVKRPFANMMPPRKNGVTNVRR